MKKFAFIGGGSFGFTRNLVKDLLTFPAFRDDMSPHTMRQAVSTTLTCASPEK